MNGMNAGACVEQVNVPKSLTLKETNLSYCCQRNLKYMDGYVLVIWKLVTQSVLET